MSLSTDGFTLLGNLKVPSLGVGVTSSNTPLLIKAADLTTAMTSNLRSDWGDLRLSSDEAGNTQLPLDIAATDYAWTRLTSVAADTLIYVWGNKPAAVKEIDTATYGRNAVWSTSQRRYHFEENPATTDMVDSSGNADGTRVGTFAAGDSVTSDLGKALSFTEGANYLNCGDVSLPSYQAKTVSITTSIATIAGNKGLFVVGASNHLDSNSALVMRTRSNAITVLDSGSYKNIVPAPVSGQIYRLDYVYDGVSTTSLYVDGVLQLAYGSNDGTWGAGQTLYINGGYNTESDQTTDEFEYAEYAKSPDQISIEYQNQTASGAWWIAEDAGPSELKVSPTTITSTLTFFSPKVLKDKKILLSPTTSTANVQQPKVLKAHKVTLSPINSTANVQQPKVLKDKKITLDTIESMDLVYDPTLRLQKSIKLEVIPTASFVRFPTVTGGEFVEETYSSIRIQVQWQGIDKI